MPGPDECPSRPHNGPRRRIDDLPLAFSLVLSLVF